jgi:hypothetical protein
MKVLYKYMTEKNERVTTLEDSARMEKSCKNLIPL